MNNLSREEASSILTGQNGLNADQQTRLASGQLGLVPTVLYHKAFKGAFAASSIIELLDTSNNKKTGVSSFQGDKLVENQSIVVEAVGFGFVDAANATLSSEQYLSDRNSVEAALQNSDLVVSQDGIEKFRAPISSLLTGTVGNTQADNFCYLNFPFVMVGGRSTKINIETGDSAVNLMANGKIAINFKGVATR
jgi:hypothetical protein